MRTTPRYRAFKHVCSLVGGQKGLAAKLGISEPSVSGWVRRDDGLLDVCVPEARCEPIEALVAGARRVEELRPDILWKRDPSSGQVIGRVVPIQPTRRRASKRRA